MAIYLLSFANATSYCSYYSKWSRKSNKLQSSDSVKHKTVRITLYLEILLIFIYIREGIINFVEFHCNNAEIYNNDIFHII